MMGVSFARISIINLQRIAECFDGYESEVTHMLQPLELPPN